MLPSYTDRQRGEKKRYLPSGVIGMGHNAPFNIVCMNFINIGRDGIIVKQIFAAYERAHLTAPQGGPGVPESVAIPVFHLQKHDLRVKILR